jgi:hypothetical protein
MAALGIAYIEDHEYEKRAVLGEISAMSMRKAKQSHGSRSLLIIGPHHAGESLSLDYPWKTFPCAHTSIVCQKCNSRIYSIG